MKMCQAFAQEGYSVELVAPGWQRNPGGPDDGLWEHYGIGVTFPITWMAVRKWLPNRVYHIQAVWHARTSHVDLVYTRHLGAAGISSLLGIPTIYEAHDLPGGNAGPLYFRAFLSGIGFRRLVVISQALERLLCQRYPNLRRKDIVVAPDGVDLERFADLPSAPEARRRLGLDAGRFTAGYTGHLYEGRGVELILDLAEHCEQIEFLIVGGEATAVAQRLQQAQERKLSNVRFFGFVSNAELPLYQAACEVLLMPYQRQVEASSGGNIAQFLSPMKMFEYMATGRLIISSDLPVLREVLNERNAMLCDPEDKCAWQAALQRAIAEPEWRWKLGQQAREDVQQYSWQRRVRRVMSGCRA